MSEAVHEAHPGTGTYVMVAAFLAVLTAMEITVFYVPPLKPVLVPVLLILAAAKFALIALFFMHLRYDSWFLGGVFAFPLIMATLVVVALILLFTFLSHYLVFGALLSR